MDSILKKAGTALLLTTQLALAQTATSPQTTTTAPNQGVSAQQGAVTPSAPASQDFSLPQSPSVAGMLENYVSGAESHYWFVTCQKRNVLGDKCCLRWENGRCKKAVKLTELPKTLVKKKRVKVVKVEKTDSGAVVYYYWWE